MTLQKSTEQCHGGVYKTVFKMNCSTVVSKIIAVHSLNIELVQVC